jgi:acetyl-CoA C-acetyltransferase
VVLMREDMAVEKGLKPIAKIIEHATNAHEPNWFTTAPVGAIEKIFQKTGWTVDDVDVFEINEAFAVVTMAAMKDLNIPHSKVNIHGGACALGHPIGASGARILVTLLSALKRVGGQKGIATLCIGGGEAVAVAVEMV